jgi:Flp pilus assembly pilin Flp
METSTMLESIPLVYTKLAAARHAQEGQALVEYALILGLVAVICAAALSAVGTSVVGLLSQVAAGF